MKELKLREFASFIGIESCVDSTILGYRIDSRQVMPGDLFFAIKGQKVDGAAHLAEVGRRGAVAAVVPEDYEGPGYGMEILRVSSVKEALRLAAKRLIETYPVRVVAVAGSVGKTTVKDFVYTLLSKRYHVHKAPLSHNSKVTMPLTLLNRKRGDEIAVLEMGMSEPGNLASLLEIVSVEVAVISEIGLVHAENFPGGLDEIAKEELTLLKGENVKRAIYPYHHLPFVEQFGSDAKENITCCTKVREADFYLSKHENLYAIDERGVRLFECALPFNATHHLENFLKAVAVARYFKLTKEEILAQIPELKIPSFRFVPIEKEGAIWISDCYNSSPLALQAAMENLPVAKEGAKRIAVLGSMMELGTFSESAHIEAGYVAAAHADYLLAYGDEAKHYLAGFEKLEKRCEHFSEKELLRKRLLEIVKEGDVVLVKGSRSLEMEELVP